MLALKQELYQQLQTLVDKQIAIATENINSAKISQENDTKSTAGDKHETGRAMLHLEQENNQKQLAKALQLKQELASTNINQSKESISKGCLVYTENGKYFLSIGIGKLVVAEQTVFAISLASPIGQLLLGKRVNDTFDFQGKAIKITAVF